MTKRTTREWVPVGAIAGLLSMSTTKLNTLARKGFLPLAKRTTTGGYRVEQVELIKLLLPKLPITTKDDLVCDQQECRDEADAQER